jgi:hypothetical protein
MKRTIVFVFATMLACDSVYEVTLQLDDAGGGAPSGFQCLSGDASLASELLDPAQGKATIVLDVLDFGPNLFPCRPNLIVNHCTTEGCPLLQRSCYPIHLTSSASLDAVHTALAQLEDAGAGLYGLPTDRMLMVRITGTIESVDAACATNNKHFIPLDKSVVFGCAYSCPTYITASGVVDVQLDTLTPQCGPEVRVCADLEVFDGGLD